MKEEVENTSPILEEELPIDSDLQNLIVGYVGEKLNPEDDKVTVGMIVEVFANEFPQFVLALAEENWIRGYHQALRDVDEGIKASKETEE
tara:strand:+ start:1692 stop:1961 length:270 start_codon:yes stop_codon:yes gene_type:complete